MILVINFPKLVRSVLTCRECCGLQKSFSSKNAVNLIDLLNKTFKMPKPTPHTVVLKKQRQKLKEKSLKYTPGTVNLQVLGSGAHGAPRSLYMFTDQSRYLFNCGEGTQRLAHEHKMKLSKLEHIFVTHNSWENVGGLPGLALTIQDVGVPQITLHGPPGTDLVFAGTRRFVVLRHLAVRMARCERDMTFEDNVMKVRYVPLFTTAGREWRDTPLSERSKSASPERNGVEDSADDDIDYYAYWNNGTRSRSNSPSRNDSPGQNKKRRHLSPENNSDSRSLPPAGSICMAYICRLQDRLGTLDLRACVAQGVPPGPLLGKLKAGEDVQLPNGNIVRSKDVTSPDEPGPVFIVVECPGEEFLDSLLEEESFRTHQSSTENAHDAASLVVHFTPSHVMQLPRYREWMSRFPPATHHLLLNDSNSCQGSVAVHRIQHKLGMLSRELFPPLALQQGGGNSEQNGVLANDQEEKTVAELKKSFAIIMGYTLNTVHLRPQRFIDWSPKLRLEPDVWRQEALDVEGFAEELATLQHKLATLPDEEGEFPHVVFLGTGSCIPSKTRNTSGILVNFSESSSMLMDCGEATYGQLYRLYGSRTPAVLQGLRAIYVSHLHADHHMGLVALLQVAPRPLYLLAPRQIRTWLRTYHKHFRPVMDGVTLVPNDELLYYNPTLEAGVEAGLLESLGVTSVRTCPVKHCPNAFGVAVTHQGCKITYSGDTMPSDDLVKLGTDSTLLIHEATMEDDLESEAKIKMHSTTGQAIEVGRKMGAKFTLLTHFSQRYAKVPMFNESFTPDVGIAFDNMKVRLGDVAKLPKMYPAMKLMFAEHYEEMEQKAVKRQLQLEREARLKT